MAKVEKFEDLAVWKESSRFSVSIYQALKDSRDWALRDQIQRSSISIPSNIAEGYDRQSNKEYIQFLYIARGSCAELRAQLYIANEINLLSTDQADEFIDKTKKISAMLYRLIKVRSEKFS